MGVRIKEIRLAADDALRHAKEEAELELRTPRNPLQTKQMVIGRQFSIPTTVTAEESARFLF